MIRKKIILSTICPQEKNIQLALYYLKSYFNKHCALSGTIPIENLTFGRREKVRDVARSIIGKKPAMLSFSCYVWNITNILKVCKLVKKALPGIKLLLGGPEVSPRPHEILKEDSNLIDIVIIGEGEESFKEVVECLIFGRKDLSVIAGIAYRAGNRIILNKRRSHIANLDMIPSPYLEGLVDIDKHRSIPTETHRGCPYRCHYCYYHKEFENIRYFSLERVEKELEFILKRKPKEVYLMDPTFNANKKRAKEILRIFIKYNKITKLHLELKAELLDKETVELLHKANISFLEIGIQSTNPKTLALINRHFAPEAFKRGIHMLNQKNIYGQIQLIDGLPQDDYETLKESVDWLYTLRPSEIRIMRLMLLPGTYLRAHARRFKITYEPRPQYRSFKSDTFLPLDLKKTVYLRRAMGALYQSHLLRESLYVLTEDLGIKFSRVFEEWLAWTKIHKKRTLKKKGLKDMADRQERMLDIFRQINFAKQFVKYLYKKYNISRKDDIPGKLRKTLLKDQRAFLKRKRLKSEKVKQGVKSQSLNLTQGARASKGSSLNLTTYLL